MPPRFSVWEVHVIVLRTVRKSEQLLFPGSIFKLHDSKIYEKGARAFSRLYPLSFIYKPQ